MTQSGLKNHLSIVGGTILILNIILGSGLLVLPGLVYKEIGTTAILSWLLVGGVTFPILLVVVQLGRKYPSAGGVSHYAKMAFGNHLQLFSSLLFLGAVSFGLPSISLTGGFYVDELIGSDILGAHFFAGCVIVGSGCLAVLNLQKLKKAISVIGGVVIAFIVVYLILSCISLYTAEHEHNFSEINFDTTLMFTPFMMIFFSFTGWEIASHLTEEFENPERDFPIAMIFSFFLVSVLYLLSAWLVQRLDISSSHATAFTSVTRQLLGSTGALLVPLFAIALVFSNIFGATWAVSRLVYYLALEGYLPAYFTIDNKGVPVRCVILTSSVLMCVLLFSYFEFIGIEDMFALAGQNFFLVYGIAAAALFVLCKDLYSRCLAVIVLISIVGILSYSNVSIGYPLAIFVVASVLNVTNKWYGQHR